MVDQSELAFRRLTRRYGAQLVYTPMINAKMFADTTHKYREQNFDIASGEEGAPSLLSSSSSDTDRPLIVQFCSNDPDALLRSAKLVEAHCDAVDINLGCPQDIARRGHYGSFLQDEWDLIYNMINTLHKNLSVPVTAKFRVFPSIEKTVEYAKMLERAGAQIITCHGRTREQRGQNTGLASYAHIAAVKRAVSIPVFANGNVLFAADVQRCIDETGADGVMSAEGVLYNPALFRGLSTSSTPTEEQRHNHTRSELTPPLPHSTLALEYLSIVRSQRTRTSPSAVKGHLFKILRPALGREGYHDLREKIGKVRVTVPKRLEEGKEEEGWAWVDEYEEIVRQVAQRLEIDERITTQNGTVPIENLVVKDEKTGLDVLPWWIAQPYFRPLPPDVPVDPHGKKAGKVKVVEAEKAKDQKDQKELLHDCTNSVEPAAGAVPAKRRPPEEIDGDAGSSADGDGVKRVKLALEEGGVAVGAV
ncbi:tRNA-dihydrouridine synthase 1 [Termitomyces sp. J132]|nr:hypothetical protein H2248_002793 [Termitomyces sp. 'cryptogamus']KNZ76597.1 tRNA-dihydrouridine synthase 1 [Termitomyces sp. J132]